MRRCLSLLGSVANRHAVVPNCRRGVEARALVGEDHASLPVKCIASLGAFGKFESNSERDLHRWLTDAYGLTLRPYVVNVPLVNKRRLGLTMTKVPLLLPHEIFGQLYAAGSARWGKSVIGPSGAAGVSRFWLNVLSGPWVDPHREHLSDRGFSNVVPFVVHSDGAAINSLTEMQIWSVASLLTRGDSLDTKFVVAVCPVSMFPTARLRSRMRKIVARVCSWSAQILRDGVYPDRGHAGMLFPDVSLRAAMAGKPIAGLATFVFAGYKADLKCRKESNEFHRFYGAEYICDVRVAQRPTNTSIPAFHFGDFSATAAWRDFPISHETYMASESVISPWAAMPGWRLESNWFDIMHILHLGVLRDVIASVLDDLASNGLLRLSYVGEDTALKDLFLQFKQWCIDHGLSYPPTVFSLALIGRKPRAYPELSGDVKAAHMQNIVTYLTIVCNAVCDASERLVNRYASLGTHSRDAARMSIGECKPSLHCVRVSWHAFTRC